MGSSRRAGSSSSLSLQFPQQSCRAGETRRERGRARAVSHQGLYLARPCQGQPGADQGCAPWRGFPTRGRTRVDTSAEAAGNRLKLRETRRIPGSARALYLGLVDAGHGETTRLSKARCLQVPGAGHGRGGGSGRERVGRERAPDFFHPHLASAMEGLPVAPRGWAARPTHGKPTLLTSGKRKEAMSPARGRGQVGMRPETLGTADTTGGCPLPHIRAPALPPTHCPQELGWGPR